MLRARSLYLLIYLNQVIFTKGLSGLHQMEGGLNTKHQASTILERKPQGWISDSGELPENIDKQQTWETIACPFSTSPSFLLFKNTSMFWLCVTYRVWNMQGWMGKQTEWKTVEEGFMYLYIFTETDIFLSTAQFELWCRMKKEILYPTKVPLLRTALELQESKHPCNYSAYIWRNILLAIDQINWSCHRKKLSHSDS